MAGPGLCTRPATATDLVSSTRTSPYHTPLAAFGPSPEASGQGALSSSTLRAAKLSGFALRLQRGQTDGGIRLATCEACRSFDLLLERDMSFAKAVFIGSSVLLTAACGGSAFSGGGDGEGGSSGKAGSTSNAGKPGAGGTNGTGGSGSTAGRPGSGGTVGTAGGIGVGGSTSCELVLCAYPMCSDGAEPVIKPGECCPTCPPTRSGCETVTCQPVMACSAGYELAQPEGACCKGCVPKAGGVACTEIACPPDDVCPAGYVRGDLVGGCCYDCVPDPLYCVEANDCVVADRPRSCCGCPEAISERMYEADECWSDVNAPRMIPQSCYPQVTCGQVCGQCPPPGPLLCSNHRCSLGMPK